MVTRKSARLCLVLVLARFSTYRIFDQLGCPTGHSAFFHDDRARPCMLCYLGCDCLKGGHVRRTSLTRAARFGWRIDRDQDHICFGNTLAYLSAEKKIGLSSGDDYLTAGLDHDRFSCAISGDSHDFLESGLIDWGVPTIPTSDSALIEVNNCHADMRVAEGDHGCRGAACIKY